MCALIVDVYFKFVADLKVVFFFSLLLRFVFVLNVNSYYFLH